MASPKSDGPSPATASPEIARVYAQRQDDWGEISGLFRLVGENEAALVPFSQMSRYIRRGSALPPRTLEMVALRVAGWLDLDYIRTRHLDLAAAAGLTNRQISALADVANGQIDAVFPPEDLDALRVVDELMTAGRVTPAASAAVSRRLTSCEIVDLCLTVGWYQLIGCLIRVLDP